jgi:SAM-dependent methyltransferase
MTATADPRGVRPPLPLEGAVPRHAAESPAPPAATYPVRGSDPPYVRADLLYGRLLATAAQHALGGGPPPRARVRSVDGTLEPLPLDRWLGGLDAADAAAAALAAAPVLDLGCGPGRHLAALHAAGKRALGVDLSPVAVRLARRRGAAAIPGDVFGSVPGAGRYRTALLLDGNVGIGGSPALLLRRTRELLAPGGGALVELDPPGAPTVRTRIRLEAPGVVSEWFAWARVGVDGIGELAAAARLDHRLTLSVGGRWIAVLRRP